MVMVETLGKAVCDFFSNFWAVLTGCITAIIGYFMPIFDIMWLIVVFFIIDVLFGYWAAKKLRGEKFSKTIIFKTTIPKMIVSFALVICAFMWDSVYKQDFVSTYRVIGWFISGIVLYSIAQNGYSVTKWEGFPLIALFLKKKIKDTTGIDMEDKNGKV